MACVATPSAGGVLSALSRGAGMTAARPPPRRRRGGAGEQGVVLAGHVGAGSAPGKGVVREAERAEGGDADYGGAVGPALRRARRGAEKAWASSASETANMAVAPTCCTARAMLSVVRSCAAMQPIDAR
jgi:hypothetical protein